MANRTANLISIALLGVHAALLAYGATKHSPSIDEVGHMAAGLSHWRLRRFDLYRVNPPLARLVATAPVALMQPVTDWNGYSLLAGARSEFKCGERFIHVNSKRSFHLFTAARWASIPISLLGGYVCYRWGTVLYGRASGLLALALWCFCPNILAHAQMITPDVAAAATGAAAYYLFWRWLHEPTWRAACVAGIVLGIAELTKATFLVLYGVIPFAWLYWRFSDASRRFRSKNSGARPFPHLIVMGALSLYILNLGYALEGSLQPLGTFNFISDALGGSHIPARADSAPRNRFAETALSHLRVPLPANYLLGIDSQKFDFEVGYNSYLRGQWRHGGWWYYYLYGLAIKVPLGTLALFLLSVVTAVSELWKRRRGGAECNSTRLDDNADAAGGGEEGARRGQCVGIQRITCRDEFVLLLPAIVILALVSSQTGFNHHLRYVLPMFPFVFIWIGRLGPYLELGVPRLTVAVRRVITDGLKVGSNARPDTPSPQPSPGGRGGSTLSSEPSPGVASGSDARAGVVVAALAGLALTWSIASSLWYYPHSLSYFNELVGGPLGGRWHMLDSNIDWGQDLLYLKTWLDENPDARPLGLAYFGYFDPRAAGIAFSLPPRYPVLRDPNNGHRPPAPATAPEYTGPLPGWYAVSVNMLHGFKYALPDGKGDKSYIDGPFFTYFQRFEPVARAGYSIYIYHLELPEVERVRREMGLPPLSKAVNSADRGDEQRPLAKEAS